MASRRGTRKPEPVRITTAPQSHHDDIVRRRRRYVVSMSIRTLCFIGAIVFPPPARWFLIAGALILPYIAVVMANAASPRIPGTDLVDVSHGRKELG